MIHLGAMHNPSSPFHIADPLLGERVILSLAVTTPLGIAIADTLLRVVTTALVAVLTSLAVSGINAAIRRVQRRWGLPEAKEEPGAELPRNTRREAVHPEETVEDD